MIRMEWGNRSLRNAYLDRSVFYRYLLRDNYVSRPRSRMQRQSSLHRQADISTVLERTDPWAGPIHVLDGYGLLDLAQSYFSQLDVFARDRTREPGENLHTAVPSFRHYAPGDPLERFLSGKRESLGRSALDILSSVYERQRLHEDQMQRMDRETCSIGSGLLQIEGCPVGAHPGIDRRRDSLESQLLSLQRERRMHEVATWRDTTRLRADLRTAMGELEAENRRWGFLHPESSHYR